MNTIYRSAALFGMLSLVALAYFAVASPNPGQNVWMACCQRGPKGKRCSDAHTKADCYLACQSLCGDPDSINGRKCRQSCDLGDY